MMNYCGIQQNSSCAAYTDMGREFVVCPKPRRAGVCNSAARLAGWHMSHQADFCDSNAGNEVLDIILSKGDCQGSEQTYKHMPLSPPPFFSGSPPSRVSNPLIQDARFVEDHNHHVSIASSTYLKHPTVRVRVLNSGFSSQSSSSSAGGFASASYSSSPAVRVVGFKALSNNCRNCSVAALA